ncbi:MAG: hypothetical protein ACRDGH_15500 [Candidatus Limnocylindria bacterium]
MGDAPVMIACDWSGQRDDCGGTWVAEARDGQLVDLRPKTRCGAVEYVIAQAHKHRHLVAGFDFAFSFPDWFVARHAPPPGLWAVAGALGEEWLAACASPFWGRSGSRRPVGVELFRVTELEVRALGFGAKSAFQIAGAGAVGTGSIRGMPYLRDLEAEGFAVWPFPSFASGGGSDGPWPRTVEIYPRALTGPVRKSDRARRIAYLDPLRHRMSEAMLDLAAWSEDAFDAAVSALAMADHADELVALEPARDQTRLREGEIWIPRPATC